MPHHVTVSSRAAELRDIHKGTAFSEPAAYALASYLATMERVLNAPPALNTALLASDYAEYRSVAEWADRHFAPGETRPDDLEEFLYAHATLIHFQGGIVVSTLDNNDSAP